MAEDLESTAGGLLIKECQDKKGEVTKVTEGSPIEDIGTNGSAVFGGFTCDIVVLNNL
jgi:hypothetical protein